MKSWEKRRSACWLIQKRLRVIRRMREVVGGPHPLPHQLSRLACVRLDCRRLLGAKGRFLVPHRWFPLELPECGHPPAPPGPGAAKINLLADSSLPRVCQIPGLMRKLCAAHVHAYVCARGYGMCFLKKDQGTRSNAMGSAST